MLDHPVGGRLSESLSVLVDDRFLVIVCLCIIDEPFAVALDLGEGCVFTVGKFILSRDISKVRCDDGGRLLQRLIDWCFWADLDSCVGG